MAETPRTAETAASAGEPRAAGARTGDAQSRRGGGLGASFDLRALRGLTTQTWAAYLAGRRWFGAKAGWPREVRVRDVVPLPWDSGVFALARLEVTLADGRTVLYQLPLAAEPTPGAADAEQERATLADAPPHSAPPSQPEAGAAAGAGGAPRITPADIIAVFRSPAGDAVGALADATLDPAFRRGMADSFAGTGGGNTVFESASGAVRWSFISESEKALVVPPNVPIRLGSAEQSNTSLLFDEEAILKLFRKLERGEQPDVEVTRFLTVQAGFAHTPALLGTIEVEDAEGTAVAGMLQEFLPKSRDAWDFALARARPYFDAPRDEERPNEFLIEAERLGQVTRELHDALATGTSPEFVPEQAGAADVERWANRTKQWIRDGLALLDRQLQSKHLPRERTGEAQALLGRRERYLGTVDEIVDALAGDAGERIRIHGDYHLGQVLRTASDDFMIIDFEGEPARSLAERREKASPLRDVAGMLRSFAYAAATLGMNAGMLDVGTRELRIGRWERDVREAFLRGYLATDDERGMLPETDAHTRALLRLFETEKAFYELVYELNHRPAWTYIPMRGIAKLLA